MIKPFAGTNCTVTRNDGATYPALIQRFDGPGAELAVVYVQPADCPDDMDPYEQTLMTVPQADDRPISTLSYTPDQWERVVAWCQTVVDNDGKD